MPASFRKAFCGSPNRSTAFPALVIEKLNEALPRGVRYHTLESGDICIGPSGNEPITLSGFQPVMTPEMEAAIGPTPTPEEVLNYSYNAQKPVKLALVHPGFITVNGQEISADRFVMGAAHEIRIDEDSFVAFPSPFPESHTVEIEGEGACVELSVKQIPTESMNVEVFESGLEAPLALKYSIREDAVAGGKMSASARFTLSANPDKCASLSDVVSMLSILKAAFNGTCVIAGVLADKPKDNVRCPIGKHELQLLRKALAIEEELKIDFDPRKIVLDSDSAKAIEELYFELVEKKPVKTLLPEAKLQLDDEALEAFESMVSQHESREFAITFSRPATYSLFGEDIELESVSGIFELGAQNIERNADGTHQLIMKNPPGEPGGYISCILLKDKEQLDLYFSEPRLSDIVDLLQHGRLLSDYLKEEEEG